MIQSPVDLLGNGVKKGSSIVDEWEGELYLSWNQEGVVEEFILYWKIENGVEYNISTDSSQTEFTLSDCKLTPATWYYISLVAVVGEETSNRSHILRVGTSKCRESSIHLYREIIE